MRLRSSALAVVACLSVLAAPPSVAEDSTTLAATWSSWLPSFVEEYQPASADDCIAGRDKCAIKTAREMAGRLDRLASSCSHNAVFSLAYLRITQGYGWIRSTKNPDGSSHYADTGGMNFVVEVFARAYLHAYDEWTAGGMPPLAWQLAFDAAQHKQVTGTGDLLLGISAHINRDLPFVMAAAGLVGPDGKSRKPDFDKVNLLLYKLTAALNAEQAQRFDPAMSTGTGTMLDPAVFQAVVGWRERAWRNAEALVSARTATERELVAQRIEATAASEASLILASNSYAPPVTTTTKRDNHCAAHRYDAPPVAYPFAVE